jgi:hypothetical protein
MAFGAHLMSGRGVWFSPVYDGVIEPVVLSDEFGPLSIWMIPFLKPAVVRAALPEADCSSYDSAFRAVVETLPLDRNTRNVAVAHQFLTGSARCESEEVSVGGLDQIGASAFEGFDYAALATYIPLRVPARNTSATAERRSNTRSPKRRTTRRSPSWNCARKGTSPSGNSRSAREGSAGDQRRLRGAD